MAFSWRERDLWFNSLTANPPEVLVIGGGVAGCSIAAHAAALGLNVVLVEREDLASGASGNSTGLAHAGLRYLAQGNISYVFRESRERQRLEEIAPQWVRPFNFILPVYDRDLFPLWKVRLGTWIYDLFTWIDSVLTRHALPRRHRNVKAEELVARIPGLKTEGLQGAAEYFVDARLQDARFTLGWAQKAARHGARILTYTEISGLQKDASSTQKVVCTDRRKNRKQELIVPLVINATGAWIDEVRKSAGLEQPVVQPSRGIHLIVDQIASSPLIFSTEVKDKVFFIIPVGHDLSIVGTTEAPQASPIDKTAPDDKEVTELIRRIFQFFPYLKQGSNVNEAIILYQQVHVRNVYWGVRPLTAQSAKAEKASREHRLVKDSTTFWSIPGVKLTAARAVGLEVAQAAWQAVRKSSPPSIPSTPLPGGEFHNYDHYVDDARRRFKLGENTEELLPYLVSMYGTRYVDVLKWVDMEPHYRERILPEEPWIPAEAAHAAQEEMILTLSDFLWRRTKWAHYRDIPEASLHRILNILSESLGWEMEQVEKELRSYHEELRKHRLS